MSDLITRLRLFAGIVWRPVTGPSGNEPPMTDWQVWWSYGLGVRTAWQVAFVRTKR
jgi:hypothetical protein